jgi:ligand-binding sensor domain-containing protein
MKDGLAGSVVYDVLQDKEGFMWFATENGLSRFDGKDFKTFTTNDGLPDNEILKLFLDSKGRLWIMPFKASICYYFKGKIHNKRNDSLVSKIKLISYAADMAEDKNGNLFFMDGDVWHKVLKSQTTKTIRKINNMPFFVDAMGTNKNGEVEILIEAYPNLTGDFHYLFNTSQQKIKRLEDKPGWTDLSTSLISPDYLVIGSKHYSNLIFFEGSPKMVSTKIPLNTISISYINRNKISINTRTGIEFFDPEEKVFSPFLFKDFKITSAFEDKEKNLWLTTQGSGILMVPSFEFRNYSFSPDKGNSEITTLYRKGTDIFVGGWGKNIWNMDVNSLKVSLFTTAPFRNDKKVVSILSLNNKLLLQCNEYYQNPFTGKESALSLKEVSLGKSGILYASHVKVLLCNWPGEEKIIWYGRSTCAIEKDSGFYIGTLNGLFYKSYSGKVINLGNNIPVLASKIVKLQTSDKGILWIATKGNGVAAYSNQKLLYHFTDSSGLTSNNCTSLYPDSNFVWVGTDKGLNRIKISNKGTKITHFTMSDGLPSNVINAIVTKGEKVFVGTPKGLTYFEAGQISQTSTCDLQVTGIYISNKYWAYDTTNFSLKHSDNDVRFEFSGISFKSGGEISYQYRLLGLQQDWRTTNEKQLTFASLGPGDYTLQLQAINKYGVESDLKEISFAIQKLIWEKTWFRIIALLVLISTIWIFFQYRIKKIRNREEERAKLNQHIAELEQKAFRSQINPHFIFNSLNSIQQYVAERDISGANRFITDFSRLIRMTLDMSARASIPLSDELKYIDTYLRLEKSRLENKFNYTITIDESLCLDEIYLPPLLLQPYVENSIRHGIKYKRNNEGIIQISIQKKESGIVVSIEDNGIGREGAQKYKSKYHIQYQSMGMKINKDRVDILNSYNGNRIDINVVDMHNERNEPTGTRVDIYLSQQEPFNN